MKDKILSCAQFLFTRFGIRHISQDQIANELKISKKTLYKIFPNKDILVRSVFEQTMQTHQEELERIRTAFIHPLRQLVAFFNFIYTSYEPYYPLFLDDLYKSNKEGWERYLAYRSYLSDYIQHNLKEGITQHVFRKDLDPPVLANYVVALLQIPFRNEISLANTTKKEVYDQLITHFIYGVVTESGRAEYENILSDASLPTLGKVA